MALQMSINRRKDNNDHDNENDQQQEFDEDIDETEDDLIENYRFLTQHCGVLRQSPTTGILSTIQQQQQQQTNQSLFLRPYSSIKESRNNEYDRALSSNKPRCSSINDSNDNNNNNNNLHSSTIISRLPPTIYYDDTEEDSHTHNRSFSVIKLFARMKTRLKHDRRYRPKPTHKLLTEADPQEWYELTKNVRPVLIKVLLPEGRPDPSLDRVKKTQNRYLSSKKSREFDPVLFKEDDEDKIELEIDDEFSLEGNEDIDQIIWQKFLTCSRGFNYRRCAISKAVDRQQFQGQLAYFYGVANNILIDENLRASGLG